MHRSLFFGREGELSELVSLVVSSRVVLFYSASGAGKTSLLNAALIPALEAEEGFEVMPVGRVRGLVRDESLPTEVPNIFVFNVLSNWVKDVGERRGRRARPASSSVPEHPQEMRSEPREWHPGEMREPGRLAGLSLAAFLKRRKAAGAGDGADAPRAIVFDQFEELFSVHLEHWRERQGFFEQLAEALDADPLIRVVLAIREDYLAQVDRYADLLPDSLRTRFRLERLGPEAALDAVKRPLEGTRRSFAKGVAEKLVEELRKFRVETGEGDSIEVLGEFADPVQLQVVCRTLWSDLPAKVTRINQRDRERYGDVNRALSRFYTKAIEAAAKRTGLDTDDLRRWFEKSFITSMGTRNMVYRTPAFTAGKPNEVIDELENRHLIRAEWRAGARWYELSHDRLIGSIQFSNQERFHGLISAEQPDASRLANLALARAETARSEGRHQDALAAAEEARELSERLDDRAGRAAALMKLSEIRLELDELDEARQLAERATQIYRDLDDQLGLAEAYRRIGVIHDAAGDDGAALESFDRARQIFRERADPVGRLRTLLGMLNVLTPLGRFGEAEELIREGLEVADVVGNLVLTANLLDYRGLVRYYTADADGALESWELARSYYHAVGEPYSEAATLQNMGYQLIRRQDFGRALHHFGQALLILEELGETRDVIDLLGFMAYSSRKAGDPRSAVDLAARGLELDPDNVAAAEQRAEAYWELGRFEEALADFDHALARNPDSAGGHNGRGQVLAAFERYEEALAAIDRAVELARNDERMTAYAQAARGLALGGLGRFAEAFQELDEALARAPGNGRAFFYRALTFERTGESERAVRDFKLALEAGDPPLRGPLRERAEAALAAAVV